MRVRHCIPTPMAKRLLWLGLVMLVVKLLPSALAASPTVNKPVSSRAYVSDQVDIPLRAGASNRHKIIGSARTGAPVTVLAVDAAKGYSQIRTASGTRGWLPSSQLSELTSSQEQLVTTRQELEQLKAQYFGLQQHVDGLVDKPDAETVSYPQLYDEALRLRQQLAQYRKVAADTVAIDERNKNLQEQVVSLEYNVRIIEQENQKLRNENDHIRLLMGLVVLVAVLLLVVLAPRLLERRRTQWSQL